MQYKDESLTLFALGHLSLAERVMAEDYFWGICQKILRVTREMDEVPEEFEGLERMLRTEPTDGPEDVLLRDVPKRNLHVA